MSEQGQQGGMSGGRRLVVSGFIACVVGLQLLDVARQGEHWPFAQYAMYASEHGGDITWYRVYGVTANGEFPLDRDEFYSPFDGQRLSYAFAPRPPRRDLVIPPTTDLLHVIGRLYERARVAGRHDGPRLTGLRVYRVTWQLDRDLAKRDHPQRVLLGEVQGNE
jgi:hypothetical protein